MIYGYARVSTATQGRDGNSLEDQVAALEKYGCQKIIKEAFTGKTMDRPKFLQLLENLHGGDTLVVCKLDRFARTAIEGVQTVRELFERGVRVHILYMGLIENTLTGNLILTVMLAFAEYERGMIVERTQTGKAVARQLGFALPIFTARHQATIVGVCELNFCVRDGNRWTLTTINTNSYG